MKHDFKFVAFFTGLSEDLVSRIAKANRQLLEKDFAPDLEKDSAPDEDLRWSAGGPSDEREATPPSEFPWSEAAPEGQFEACRLTIRLRLYRYLAFLARSPLARRGETYPIFKVLPAAMGHLLGIEDERFKKLTDDLTREFRDWLDHQEENRFDASWGVMLLIEDSNLKLMAEEAREQTPRRPRDSFPAYRRGSIRGR
jgi:hypothetical protein